MNRVKQFVRNNNWVYVAAVTILLWLLMGAATGNLSVRTLIDNA